MLWGGKIGWPLYPLGKVHASLLGVLPFGRALLRGRFRVPFFRRLLLFEKLADVH